MEPIAIDTIQKEIRGILQTPVPKATAAVSATIAGLKDFIELNGIQNDWRRGTGGGGVAPLGRFRGGGGPAPRGSPGSHDSPRSFHSDSQHPPTSPVTPGAPPPPVAKYQSRFKNSTQPVEDKILNNIILSKLNKFSPKTYDEIRDFLYQILGSGEVADLQEMTRDFMRLVFKKAAIEEVFCPLYAKLLCEISGRYKVILEEMHALQSNYLAVFDNVHETEGESYDAFVESQKSKQFRVGYSQFLAELTALEILDLGLLTSTFTRILTNMVVYAKEEDKKTLLEEYSDCLVRMAKVLRKKHTAFFVRARGALLSSCEAPIKDLVENQGSYPSESMKTKFALMDVLDILRGL